jgi:hypothetical protein
VTQWTEILSKIFKIPLIFIRTHSSMCQISVSTAPRGDVSVWPHAILLDAWMCLDLIGLDWIDSFNSFCVMPILDVTCGLDNYDLPVHSIHVH